MLTELFGSKNIQRILLFLFVNGKGYGTQMHRALGVPLTPLQKALMRLERGGIIASHFEGKTRLYQFSPIYPLRVELEQLLKKAFTLMTTEEKRNYYVIQEVSKVDRTRALDVLMPFWEKLKRVRSLHVHAQTSEAHKWQGRGQGEVVVEKGEGNVLIFHEKGAWQGKTEGFNFSNCFRWTLDRYGGVVSLEHLRRGADHPVFLFHLAPSGKGGLASIDSHLCDGDAYFGKVHFDRHGVYLSWRVIGDRKNETMSYTYVS